jgi:V/A-type H+/Na+-transporting ATPase subunit D
MARIRLSKSALQQQRSQLRLYQKLLPSLDLKRRQLLLEHKKAQAELAEAQAAVDRLEAAIGAELPMLADTEMDLKGLVHLRGGQVGAENVAGVTVPRLEKVECQTTPYSPLARPAWVDRLVQRLADAAELRVRVKVQGERARVLERAVRRITQRVNLFERILIPGVKQNIKRIQVFLGDLDREAVIRSKLSKGKHAGRGPQDGAADAPVPTEVPGGATS